MTRNETIPSSTAAKNYAPLVVGLIGVLAAGARGWLLFRTPLLPGMNGGYYLVQARSLLEQHKLGIPDLPLTFLLQAILAKLVQLVSNSSLENSILFAVKITDAILPALVAIPVFALTRRWSSRVETGAWVPACVAMATAVGAPALIMVGDFQKNSLGLVWLAALLWSLHGWLEHPTTKRGALTVLFLTLAGLTHIGVFGWALALSGFAVTIALWRCDAATRRKILPWLIWGGAACALAAALVLWKFDPARVQRLGHALSHPVSFLTQSQRFHNQPMNAKPAWARSSDAFSPPFPANHSDPDRFSPPRDGRNRPGGGPGMMIGLGQIDGIISAAFIITSLGSLLMVFICRKSLTVGDVAVVAGCASGLLLLAGPWVTGDKVMRFQLIAAGPALVCAAFSLLQLRGTVARNVIMALITLVFVGSGMAHLARGGRPVITQEAADELRAMSAKVTSPGSSLIVARHGLEWWTAWFLHTHIAHADMVTESDWKKFAHVFYLKQEAGMPMSGLMMGGRPGRPGAGRGNFPRPGQFPPAPGDFPGGMTGPPPGGPGMGGPGGMMGEPIIPRDAQIVHEGKCFTLAAIASFSDAQETSREDFGPPPGDDLPPWPGPS